MKRLMLRLYVVTLCASGYLLATAPDCIIVCNPKQLEANKTVEEIQAHPFPPRNRNDRKNQLK